MQRMEKNVPVIFLIITMPTISAQNFLKNFQDTSHRCQVIDVRTPFEWNEWSFPKDSRIRYEEMNTIPEILETLPKNIPLYILCRSGNRSGTITAFLKNLGYDAINIEGGIMQIRFLQTMGN